jgi:hypothetical protein
MVHGPPPSAVSHHAHDDEKAGTGELSLDGEPAVEEAPRAPVPTTRCPNCGRRFAGTYCPGCGVPIGRPRSILGMASACLQELINVRRGLWATLKALTLRPGPALRRYLGTGPRLLMTPGRYLLAAIVVSFGSIRALTGLGVERRLPARGSITTAPSRGPRRPEGPEVTPGMEGASVFVPPRPAMREPS